MRILLIGLIAIFVAGPDVHAQTDWDALRKVPRGSNLDIRELGDRGHTEGKLLLVEDTQLTILRGGRAVVVPRALIGRIQHRKSDPIWGGMILGMLIGALAYSAPSEACYGRSSTSCILAGASVYGALGAFVDWRIQRRETVYRAPKRATTTLLHVGF